MSRGWLAVAAVGLALSLTPVVTAQATTDAATLCELKQDWDHDRDPWTPPIRKGSMFEPYDWRFGWYLGNFWGGPQNVQVHHSLLGPPCGE